MYPTSVMPYIGAGLIDKRLFNVTLLLRDGYGDAHADRLPLILTYKDAGTARRATAVPEGATEMRALNSIRGKSITEDLGAAHDFWFSLTGGDSPPPDARGDNASPAFAKGVAKVWLDGKVKVSLADTVAQIAAPPVWAKGNTGQGVDVAVLDTGVDAQHPDLAGQIEAGVSFVPGEDVTDHNGHGTHVASTVAGSGDASNGKERGVAPGARLHIAKVLDEFGSGFDSWILAGMEWAAREQKAKIISMSLGGSPTDGTDPLSQAVNTLSEETGALFVVAAGNNGPTESTVGTPGAADAALTVGAVDSADHLAEFSSRGPRYVDHALKPEITAPGVGVLAARSQYAPGEGFYATMSGTSMATPHVAGAAALLVANHPDWDGQQLKDALVSTAKATPEYGPYEGGSGRLDIAATTNATVFATGTAYLGIHPQGDEQSGSTERRVTYTNTSSGDVTLNLKVVAPGMPTGLISLSTPQVAIPAGGTRTITVSADLSRAPDGSLYTGQVQAYGSDGQLLADTVIGVSTEDRPRHLVVEATGRRGEPIPGTVMMIREGDPADSFYVYGMGNGRADLLVPEGTYALWMWGDVEGSHGPNSRGTALFDAPKVVVAADTTVRFDGTTLREIKAVTPRQSVDSEMRLDYHRAIGSTAAATYSLIVASAHDSMWAEPGPQVRDGEMSVTARWRKIQPVLTVASNDTSFDDLRVMANSGALPEGSRHLTAVFAGDGATADYAGLNPRGKAAVVRRGDLDEQVAAAQKAGVVLLLVVNDEPGRYFDSVTKTPLAVASLTMDLGDHLISQLRSRGQVNLQVESHPVTDYLYDLVRQWSGTIPSDLTYRPRQSDLAQVDVDFHSKSSSQIFDYRYDMNPHLKTRARSLPADLRFGRFRTDWVTADSFVRWAAEVEAYAPDDFRTFQSGGSTVYPRGRSSREQWLGPIQRPRINDSVALPRREGDRITVEAPGWGDSGADHVSIDSGLGALDQTISLQQGGAVIERVSGSSYVSSVTLSPRRLPYRIVTTTERDPAAYPYSIRTRTAWDFISGSPKAGKFAQLPLIQLDYVVDTDLEHKAARSAKLTLRASHLPGGPTAKSIDSAGLKVSYDDGATWSDQRMRRTANGWETQLHAPDRARHITLRAQARDSDGNGVEQTVVRAFGLR
ncbi:S8 family serine peptidase [Streptomyces sp. PA03-6a]|nr:S8 family serine peptidase [Streptomyces sp. PA03-6a]